MGNTAAANTGVAGLPGGRESATDSAGLEERPQIKLLDQSPLHDPSPHATRLRNGRNLAGQQLASERSVQVPHAAAAQVVLLQLTKLRLIGDLQREPPRVSSK